MTTNADLQAGATGTQVPQREVELPAAVLIAWSLAGGLLLGGVAVVGLLATDRLSAHAFLMMSVLLYAVGAALGLLHGLVLGIFGRPDGTTPRVAAGQMAHGLIYLVPALLLGWLTAGWVATLPIALHSHKVFATAVSVLAWLLTFGVLAFAAGAGLDAAKLAYRRWPDRVPGTLLVGATFVALAVTVAIRRPTIWFTDVRLTGIGAAAFVIAATFWFYGPIITTGLALLRKVRPLLPVARFGPARGWRDLLGRAGLAGAAGVVVALLAVPFSEGVLGIPTDASRLGVTRAVVLAVADAVADELALRLFLFTVAFVLVMRFVPPKREWAVGVAVAVATLADMLVYWPAVPALGLPGVAVTVSYVVARMAIPAVLFGYVFWRRGLGTAIAAHASAGAVLGLLTI